MKQTAIANLRNFVILGHTGSGKTSLADALAFKLGLNDRMGLVDSGSSMSDFTEEEKNRKISIFAATFTGAYNGQNGEEFSFVFTDTPGYMDFLGQVVAGISAADAALLVVDASSGVQVGTRRAWDCCQQRGLKARAIVVTGLDKDNADFATAIAGIQESFGPGCLPVTAPDASGEGVTDLLAGGDEAGEARTALIEKAAETDDGLVEKYLEGQELSAQEIAGGLRTAVSNGELIPVFVCLPLQGGGLAELCEGICRLLPSPEEAPVGDAGGEAVAVSPDEPFRGLVWRTVVDPFVGQMNFVRIIGGTLRQDNEVLNHDTGAKEKIGSMLVTAGRKQTPVKEATAGDIVAIPKLKTTKFNHTLCAPEAPVALAPIKLPSPVAFSAISASTQADEDKLGTALSRLCEQDPTLQVERNSETHQIVLKGLGDVHIDVATRMMKQQSNVQVDLGLPKVPYRETVTAMGEGHHKHKKQSGGRGQYGEVYLRVEPKPPDEEEWFLDEIVGGAIPHNFIPAVQKGVVEGMTRGSVAGYPVQNIKVHIYDGSYHDVDSSEVAFKIAASRALREGMAKAKPVLLEPIMKTRITIPDQFMGDVNGDLNHKRGRILGMETEGGMQAIMAEIPQAELFRYAAELRSMTGGQGTFELEFDRYDVVPANITQKIVAEAQSAREDED